MRKPFPFGPILGAAPQEFDHNKYRDIPLTVLLLLLGSVDSDADHAFICTIDER